MDHEESDFHVRIVDERVCFEFKKHYATEEAGVIVKSGV